MIEKGRLKDASRFLHRHCGPWEKALGTKANALRVGLAESAQFGEIPIDRVRELVRKIREMKTKPEMKDAPVKIIEILHAAEKIFETKGASPALEHLHTHLNALHLAVTSQEIGSEIFQRAGLTKHEMLLTPRRWIYAIFATATALGDLKPTNLQELNALLAKLDETGKERFSRRIQDVEDAILTDGPAKGFLELVKKTKLLLPGENAEEEFELAGQRAEEAMRGGRRRREGTMIADLNALAKAEEEHRAGAAERRRLAAQAGAGFDLEAYVRRVERLRDLRQKARATVTGLPIVTRRKLGQVALQLLEFHRSPALHGAKLLLEKSRASAGRLKQLISSHPFRVVHPSNTAVSEKHVLLKFIVAGIPQHPGEGIVGIIDRNQPKSDKHTIVTTGTNLERAIFVQNKQRTALEAHAFPPTGGALKLTGKGAALFPGHEFQVGPNSFRVGKVNNRQVVLHGVAGPVFGMVFKFDPTRHHEVHIGRSPENTIQLLDRKPDRQEVLKRG